MKWCMLNTKGPVTSASIWLNSDPTKSGANHDGVNILYPWLPPEDLLSGLETKLVYNYELAETDRPAAIFDLIKQSAVFMLSDSSNILTGEQWMFESMHRTAYHRLWCERYSEDEALLFESDFLSVFGVAADTTTIQASRMIKAHFA